MRCLLSDNCADTSGAQGREVQMFTGIIADIGEVLQTEQRGDLRIRILTGFDIESIDIGSSIACDGACLTVVATGTTLVGTEPRGWFDVELSAETLSATRFGLQQLTEGTQLNLERALRVGDELGGHIVSGHVDGVAEVVSVKPVGDSLGVKFKVPEKIAIMIAPKGSVALNGTSLTVNEATDCIFGVNIIPHTQKVTTWCNVVKGDLVNIEIDMLARYVARLRGVEQGSDGPIQ